MGRACPLLLPTHCRRHGRVRAGELRDLDGDWSLQRVEDEWGKPARDELWRAYSELLDVNASGGYGVTRVRRIPDQTTTGLLESYMRCHTSISRSQSRGLTRQRLSLI